VCACDGEREIVREREREIESEKEFGSMYSQLHLECHLISISISTLNLLGLFSTERGKET